MIRILIHAGFHKTGTSSVQAFLANNAAILAPEVRIFLKDDLLPVTRMARAYSKDRSPEQLKKLQVRMRHFLRSLDPGDNRPVLISSEDLAGHMPGRLGIENYGALPQIAGAFDRAAKRQFGADVELGLYLSTRGADPWLRSSWWQNLRSTRLQDDFELYAERLRPAADFEAVLSKCSTVLGPGRVLHMPLEDTLSLPEGPAAPLLELVGISAHARGEAIPLARRNTQPDAEVVRRILELNRSDMDETRLIAAKMAEMRRR